MTRKIIERRRALSVARRQKQEARPTLDQILEQLTMASKRLAKRGRA